MDLTASGGGDRLPHQPMMLGHELPKPRSEAIQQPRRTLNVGEQQRHQVTAHARDHRASPPAHPGGNLLARGAQAHAMLALNQTDIATLPARLAARSAFCLTRAEHHPRNTLPRALPRGPPDIRAGCGF
jgi:hypothetical protein